MSLSLRNPGCELGCHLPFLRRLVLTPVATRRNVRRQCALSLLLFFSELRLIGNISRMSEQTLGCLGMETLRNSEKSVLKKRVEQHRDREQARQRLVASQVRLRFRPYCVTQ